MAQNEGCSPTRAFLGVSLTGHNGGDSHVGMQKRATQGPDPHTSCGAVGTGGLVARRPFPPPQNTQDAQAQPPPPHGQAAAGSRKNSHRRCPRKLGAVIGYPTPFPASARSPGSAWGQSAGRRPGGVLKCPLPPSGTLTLHPTASDVTASAGGGGFSQGWAAWRAGGAGLGFKGAGRGEPVAELGGFWLHSPSPLPSGAFQKQQLGGRAVRRGERSWGALPLQPRPWPPLRGKEPASRERPLETPPRPPLRHLLLLQPGADSVLLLFRAGGASRTLQAGRKTDPRVSPRGGKGLLGGPRTETSQCSSSHCSRHQIPFPRIGSLTALFVRRSSQFWPLLSCSASAPHKHVALCNCRPPPAPPFAKPLNW